MKVDLKNIVTNRAVIITVIGCLLIIGCLKVIDQLTEDKEVTGHASRVWSYCW